MRYDQMKVPSGPTRKWEIVIEDGRDDDGASLSRTAVDVKRDHRVLRDIADGELRTVPLLATGTTLRRGDRYLDLDLLRKTVARGRIRAEHAEHDDAFALDLVWHADGRGFEHRRMRDRGRFDLGRTDPLARDLERVVAPALDVPEARRIDAGP